MVEARGASVDGGWVGPEMLLPPRTDGIAPQAAMSQELTGLLCGLPSSKE